MAGQLLNSWSSRSLSKILARTVKDYLRKEENRRDYEQWYQQKYGKTYQWKKG